MSDRRFMCYSFIRLFVFSNSDIVYIGTINSTHVPLSLMMLEAGKHVLCEKSMALCSAGVKKVTEFAQQKNKLFLEVIIHYSCSYQHFILALLREVRSLNIIVSPVMV